MLFHLWKLQFASTRNLLITKLLCKWISMEFFHRNKPCIILTILQYFHSNKFYAQALTAKKKGQRNSSLVHNTQHLSICSVSYVNRKQFGGNGESKNKRVHQRRNDRIISSIGCDAKDWRLLLHRPVLATSGGGRRRMGLRRAFFK